MSQNHRHPTFRQRRDRPSQNSFIGREAQLQAFRSALNTPCAERNEFIFNVSGQGGIGKTTLLKQFRKIAEDAKQAVAYVDEGAESNRVDNVPEVLDRLAADLEKQGHKFDQFRERYKVYRQKRQELETDPDAPQGFVAGLGRVVAKASLGAAKSIPGSGAVLDFVDTDAMADKTGEFAAFVARKLTNKDEVQLVNEPIEVLTPLFLTEFNRVAEKQTVVLLLDTYEQTGTFLDDWVRSLLDERYGALSSNFLLAIAGRDPLNRNEWDALEDWMLRSELEPFTEEEAQQYLISKGITHEAVIQEIWRLSSGGLPLLIGMMAQAAPTSPDAITDHCEDAVERFLKWETDAAKRQIAMDAALPRVLNRDVLALLVAAADLKGLFEWLKSRSFVIEHPEGWQYHSVVRQQMLRYQHKVSPREWTALHGKLATYYNQLRQQSGLVTVATTTNQPTTAERLTDTQRQRLTTQQAGMQADWELQSEKLKRLRLSAITATDEAIKFKLQQDIQAEEAQLAQLTTQLNDIEQALNRNELVQTTPSLPEANHWWAAPKEQWQDETWQKYTLEWLYHSLCASPQAQLGMALNGFLAALKHSRKLAQDWAGVMAIAGEVTRYGAMKVWGEQLRDGLQAYKDRKYKAAIVPFSDLLQASQLDAKWRPVALHWRGLIYRLDNERERSLQDLTEAVNLTPDEADYWLDLGRTYRGMKRHEDTLTAFNRCIELNANDASAIASRGDTYLLMGRDDEALTDFSRIIELNPNDKWTLLRRAQVYQELGSYERSLDDYNTLIQMDSKWAHCFSSRSEVNRLLYKYDDALVDTERAIELDPNDSWAWLIQAKLYLINNQFEQALIRFNRRIELTGDDPWDYYDRSLAYLALKENNLAQADLATAIQLAQTIYEQSPADEQETADWCNTVNLALYHLVANYAETADALYHQALIAPTRWRRMAIRDLQDFLTLFPDHAQAQQMVALLQSTLG